MKAEVEARHKAEVRGTYVAADRLRLYAVLTALFGALAIIAVIAAMVVGWLNVWDGVVTIAFASLFALAPAARFYADALRTTLHAARLERHLGMEEDLYDAAVARKQQVRTIGVISLVIAALLAAAMIAYAAANAGTEKPDDDDDRGEVDDDDRRTGGSSDSNEGDDGDD